MFSAETNTKITKDFSSRFIKNLVNQLLNIKSNPYFITLDRKILAKSLVGMLSAEIKYGDTIRVVVYSEISQEVANEDLEYILNLINA